MAPEAASSARHLGRALLPLGLAYLATGFSTGVVYPFLSLFLSTAVDAGPVRVTVFLVVAPLSGVAAATLIGWLSDRWPIRRALIVVAAVAGVIGTALTAVVRDYWLLLGLTVTATALAATLFPQTFAYARQVLIRDRPDRVAFGISALRTVFSLAWAAGPPLAALLMRAGGFVYLFGTAAVSYAIAALVAIFRLEPLPASAPLSSDGSGELEVARWRLLLTAAAFTALMTPLTLAVQVLPLFVSVELGGDVADAGLILGLCAALEVPLMLALGAIATRVPVRTLVLFGAVCGVAYYAFVAMASAVWQLVAAQFVDALYISAGSALGISYMQDMLPRHPGRATTLFTNTFPIGAILAGPLFGLSQRFGYRLGYVFAAALCAVGLLLLVAVRPRARTATPVAIERCR